MEEQFANQSEEVVDTAPVEETVVDDTPVEAGEAVEETPVEETPADEYDVIKYNKEDVRIPVSERQTYLQKGYNYDKVNEKATQFEQNLQRVAKFSGFENVEDFLAAVNEQEEQQRVQEMAQRMGVDEEAVKQYYSPLEKQLKEQQAELEVLRQSEFSRSVVTTINDLKSDERYKDFDDHADAIFAHMQELGMRPTKAAFETAYRAVTYDTMRSGIEQQVLSNVAARDGKTVLSSSDKPADVNFDFSSMSSEEFRKFEEDVSRRAAMGERVMFD